MVTVLHLIKGLGIGGAEKLIAEGSRFWNRESFEYHVAYVVSALDQLVPDLAGREVPVHCLNGGRGLDPLVLVRLRRLIRRTRVRLVHAHLPVTGVMARLVSPVPIVYTEHNVANSYAPLTRLANRWTYWRNRAVITVSEAVTRSVVFYPGPAPVVIPNGVACQVAHGETARARSELELGPDSPLVVHVGNIRPGKGHADLIAAVAILHETCPDATVVSIGAEQVSGELERLRRTTRNRGLDRTLRFLGQRPDAVSFVAAADVFVNPARVEGLPVAVLEAMALGRPVVATKAGGVPEIVRHGETGLLVDAGNPRALASGIEAMLSDRELAGHLAARGRRLVLDFYGLEAMVRSTEDLYGRILRSH
jgi:glycosyltransferase involved in cell wall biosynthesis